MSAKLSGMVWELDLPHKQQSVLLALADNAHDDGTHCYPGVDYLAWKTGYDRRSVQRILRELEGKPDRDGNCGPPLIVPVANNSGGRGLGLEYRIDISKGKRKRPWSEVKAEMRRQRAAAADHPAPGEETERAAKCHPLSDEMGGKMSTFEQLKGRQNEPERVTNCTLKGDKIDQKGGSRAAPTIRNQNTEPNTEPHTPRAREPSPPPDAGTDPTVCVCQRRHESAFCTPIRRRYAEHNRDYSGRPLGPGWVNASADGSSDEWIEAWLDAEDRRPVPSETPPDDSENLESLRREYEDNRRELEESVAGR